jgi:predicted nucleic acid-binding protein
MLSDPQNTTVLDEVLSGVPMLPITEGFWRRAGLLRSKVLAKKLKARVADALIAQLCIDHSVALITRNADFRHFVRYGGLKLA